MKNLQLLSVTVALVVTILLSCRKDSSVTNDTNTGVIDTKPNIVATVKGRIVDEQGKPVNGAEVRAGLVSSTTNINGEFTLNNASLFDKAALVVVSKTGYFKGSRTFTARQGRTHVVEIKLLPKAINGTINSQNGGTVTLTDGSSVTLPATAVINKLTGASYTGTINVAVAWINPTSGDLNREMPGDLRGINVAKEEKGLKTFGMMAVELTGSAGEELQMAVGKKAALKFPLPSNILATAPARIPLWNFNDSTGFWKEEGTAVKVGNSYEAEVSHFSFWSGNTSYAVVDFTAKVTDQNNNPVPNVLVRIMANRDGKPQYYYYSFTDSTGLLYGKVPANEALIAEAVSNTCRDVTYRVNIGPFSSSAEIDVKINITGTQAAIIRGNATNCSGSPVLKGSAEMIIAGQYYRSNIANGVFSFNRAICSANQPASIIVFDSTTKEQSAVTNVSLNGGNNNVGNISACGVSTVQFVKVTVGGVNTSFIPPLDSVVSYSINNRMLVNGNKAKRNIMETVGVYFIGSSTGTFVATNFFLSVPNFNSNKSDGPFSINITEYGQPGEYTAGNFSFTAIESASGVKAPVEGSFRVKRLF